jgi:hypothetical protein
MLYLKIFHCGQTFIEKTPNLVTKIASNEAIINKEGLLAEITDANMKIKTQSRFYLGEFWALKKLRPTSKFFAQVANFCPIWSH